MRSDKRKPNQLRPIKIHKHFQKYASGSCLIECGNTKVVCAASLEKRVPPFLKGTGKGWVTAEYGMLPASCTERIIRESSKGKPSGRTQEIQRLIGRSLRAVVDLGVLGEQMITVDCDVLQGDGGTRTAGITGAFVAMSLCVQKLLKEKALARNPIHHHVAAVSVGIVDGVPSLDLCYEEDAHAEVDMNVVMTDEGKFVEVQGTAEGKPFSTQQMNQLMALAKKGITELIQLQKKTLHA
ncbi:MAG: ribonuclease PH [Candidatus Omnitrophica bacterium CG11_big_fil_rev_8_21_14_0_20_45_26]|uniref:Ribonuclease PH n=1 Tax=Candidatus Abzuiibacterium crystallinum TaxID=1974748 RepID=A0A2H0LUP0_9BACT|nr:MAG: ribonuclease PH [Candidatus Omnitrophica bacterium CG11_big_fil_rev_8_21_14_0_20_45_26]PIW64954.1 MAG: ribonuclease PH [Candidatus Omnitrophica bacterium CG12_big_fil_rev_8_21_14_0_65_45_16]